MQGKENLERKLEKIKPLLAKYYRPCNFKKGEIVRIVLGYIWDNKYRLREGIVIETDVYPDKKWIPTSLKLRVLRSKDGNKQERNADYTRTFYYYRILSAFRVK